MLVLAVTLIAFSQIANAQQAIVGTVTDPSGASLPNVNITLMSAESGVVKKTQTNDAGQYVMPDMNIGHYGVKAESTGFQAAEQKNVVLQVGDRDRVDFQMQIGGTAETVTVEANPVKIQTDSGEVSNVITGQQISARRRTQDTRSRSMNASR